MNFSETKLSKPDLLLLKRLDKDSPPHRSDAYEHLHSIGFVRYSYEPRFGEGQYVFLTDLGSSYLSFLDSQKKDTSRETRRYWITTVIAIIALLKAFDQELAELLAWLSKLLAQ